MSLPRPIFPGSTYFITRRCLLRQFLLKPSPMVNQIILYCLAFASQRTGIQVHTVCAMSNHYHMVVTDPQGRLPEFIHWLDEFVAKCINTHRKRWEVFWSPGTYSSLRLETPDSVLDKIAYTLVNPVKAGLVRYSSQWPGLRLSPADLGRELQVQRPPVFFRANGPMPRALQFTLSRPSGFSEMTDQSFAELVNQEIERRQKEIHQAMEQAHRRFLGRKGVLAQSPFASPTSSQQHRKINPRIAGKDKWRRIEALQRLKSFLVAYRQAWHHFKNGVRDVLFPAGTYGMRLHAGVLCAAPS